MISDKLKLLCQDTIKQIVENGYPINEVLGCFLANISIALYKIVGKEFVQEMSQWMIRASEFMEQEKNETK